METSRTQWSEALPNARKSSKQISTLEEPVEAAVLPQKVELKERRPAPGVVYKPEEVNHLRNLSQLRPSSITLVQPGVTLALPVA